MQPRDSVTSRDTGSAATQRREHAAYQNRSSRLDVQGVDRVVCARIEGEIDRAVSGGGGDCARGRPADDTEKVATQDDLPVGLHDHRVDLAVGSRIEARVERAVWIEPTNVAPRRRACAAAAEHRKRTGEKDFPV